MNLEFTKNGDLYIAEFTAEADFNIHIEKDAGFVTLYQTSVAGGKYEVVRSLNRNYLDPVIDAAHKVLVAPLYIRLVSTTMPSVAVVSFRNNGGGGGGFDGEDVVFFDYDGAVLHSYSTDSFLGLSAMPELPTQEGLICQGWNYSFEDAQAYVADNGKLEIGATYITDDGATRLRLSIVPHGRTDFSFKFAQTVENGVEVDWGDGSQRETFLSEDVTASHQYAEGGEYVISLFPLDGCILTLTEIFPSGIADVYKYMLRGVFVGNSVTSIGSNAFSSCSNLTSITIPNSVTSIGSNAFSSCSNLTSITIPNSVTSIGDFAFGSCSNLTSVTIPNSVTSIGSNAFYNCTNLASITIPNSVTSISDSAFSSCSNLTSITIPNSVTSIGSNAFYNCTNLASVTIPNGVTSIGSGAFSSCTLLTSVTIPNSVTSIGSNAFSSCSNLTSITIPNSVTSIGDSAFSSCPNLGSITIPNSVTSIGFNAFNSCTSLASITIPNGVTSIDDNTFGFCSNLTSVTIPNSVTSIGSSAFRDCSNLATITIPNSVTSISNYAFRNCTNLGSITIPNSVTSIGNYAFRDCSELSLCDFSTFTAIPSLGSNAFNGTDANLVIVVPDALYDSWVETTNWSSVSNKIIKASEYTA